MDKVTFVLLVTISIIFCCKPGPVNSAPEILYTFPDESEPHEATWLQWPHEYQYGVSYRNSLDPTWVEMTRALVTSEKVNVIAYDQREIDRIVSLLLKAWVSVFNVYFKIYRTDDVWVRDNGPIYARNRSGNMVIQDWGFNGWGQKIDELTGQPIQFENCDGIPAKIAWEQEKPLVDLSYVMVNEGGAVEMDGRGTLMACKSSILNDNRNPGMTQREAESIFTQYLGATNFIWLDGQAGLEITDQHIDGFARFGNSNTIVTMDRDDLLEYDVKEDDIDKLYAAKNKDGAAYNFIKVPLTQSTVKKADGIDLGYKGSYVNYYIANTKVLVPNYNDTYDPMANGIIQSIYPTRTVVGIDVRNLYENGGMLHCVTQQQPRE